MSAIDNARLMAAEHCRVVPIGPGTKYPPIPEWQLRASDSVEQIAEWFDPNPQWGLGWKMGAQGDERSLFAIDVDTVKGGKAAMEELIRDYDLAHDLAHTTTARTGGGGFHFVFELPPEPLVTPINRSKLRPGIDIRAEGGQIVVAPTIHPETGLAYAWVNGKAPWETAPLVAGDGLMAMMAMLLAPPAPPLRVVREQPWHPSLGTESPADWVRHHLDFATYLAKWGWDQVGVDMWRRPGKTDGGHSAVLHNNGHGPLNVFSTEIPPSLERLGHPDASGQCLSFSLFELISAYEHGGDERACALWVRRTYMASAGSQPSTGPTVRPDVAPAIGRLDGPDATVPESLFPPREFYDQRPWMAACRQMAEAVGGSPAAHTLAFLARWATLIPPGYSIPPINGAPSSFDLLCVIAGTSGSGKTSPMRNAEEMLPVQRKDLRMGLGIGSGEGIIEAFYGIVEVERDDGKRPNRERRKCIAGVNFAVSEGLIFAELAGRGGTTHVTRLCDAWSGASLSTANASAETFRHIPVNQYRLTLVMGIQATQAHELMTDSAASQGFVGRLLFAWAEEPRVSPRPAPPEPLDLAVPPRIGMADTYLQTYLSYPPEVYAEIQAASDQRVGTDVPVEDHHHDLLRCKVAGIVALMDGRTFVSGDDWSIATALVDTSAAVRSHLYAIRRQMQRDQRHMAAEARADVEITIDDIKDRQAIARMADAIRRRVTLQEWSRNKLCKAVSSTGTRHRFDAALELAVSNGWVVVLDGHVERA